MPANSYTEDVLARLEEYFSATTHWQRTLWSVGPAFALRELSESSDGVLSGALSRAALKRHSDAVRSMLSDDPAAGEPTARRALLNLLTRDLSAGGANYQQLKLWAADIEQHGLDRWKAAVTQQDKPSREALARAIACELFRVGFSAAYMRPWVARLRSSLGSLTEQGLVDEAQALIANGEQQYQLLLTFAEPLPDKIPRPPEGRDAHAVGAWLSANGFARIRQHGGLLLDVAAPDPHAAAHIAKEVADRLSARAAVGTRHGLRFHDGIYVSGHKQPIVSPRLGRGAEVRALERAGRLLNLEANDAIDQALELLSHLNTAPAPVAAAAGWAAVESLLSGPGDEDKVVTAERLASLVACSWLRAELTSIAWARVSQTGSTLDALAREIRGYKTNRERAARILKAVRTQEPLNLSSPAERLALRRVEKLVNDPRAGLLAVRNQAADALRRLYRQRNLVVHSGLTAGFGLRSALRTARPLVGAGLDRVAHAALTSGRMPLEIAARAELEIERAGTARAPALTDLLE